MLITETNTTGSVSHHATPALAEADRLMTVCNSCRYCEGLCAVFPAMELRRAFNDGDLDYLANLCHACGACYDDCQFAPPHPFQVNVPKVLAQVRKESYGRHAWPRALAPMFERNGLALTAISGLSVIIFLLGFIVWSDDATLFGVQTGPGAFYRVMPHAAMALVFGVAFLCALVALGLAMRDFWRRTGASVLRADAPALWQAACDAATLRYLDGGGGGCMSAGERDGRRHAHHAAFYGFLLCFASTATATLYHYVLGREAPYPWWDLPVVLGTLGGLGLLAGTAGLLRENAKRDPALREPSGRGMETAFIAMLGGLGLSGLALLVLRATPAMGTLLAVHLGLVFGFFVTIPYGKFVHGFYRYAALTRYARERRIIE